MKVFVIILGIILILFSYKDLKNSRKKMKTIDIEKRLEILDQKLDYIKEVMNSRIEEDRPLKIVPEVKFQDIVEHELSIDEYEKMYAEYQNGSSISQLAEKYNRGKGEIQLILNLKK